MRSLTAIVTVYIPHCTIRCTCDGVQNSEVGTRLIESCGNGQLDPGEDCDDGNVADGDCCSAQCRFAAAGSGCTSDGNAYTDDVCNAAGACQHVSNTAPCEEACVTGARCDGGECVGGTPFASGTACDADGNVCTEDACDAAGHCVCASLVSSSRPSVTAASARPG